MPLQVGLGSSVTRYYPQTKSLPMDSLDLEGALNERLVFQVVLRLEDEPRQSVRLEVTGPEGWSIRVRRVGYVPVQHHNTPIDEDTDGLEQIPGYVPDPLFDEDTLLLPAQETHAFWVTLQPDAQATPGTHRLSVRVLPESAPEVTREVNVRLYDVVLQPRRDFHITHWFYIDALLDWYRLEPFESRFWTIVASYIRDLADHGIDTLYVPVFTPPLDGVKRPSQLLHVTRAPDGSYRFNWRDVKRYVDLAKASGISHFEWCHFFTQWGVQHAIRIYEGQGQGERLLWPPDAGATSETYRNFLAQFLPQLYRFLQQESILDRSFFHVSDEPHAEHLPQYHAARAMLKELAPWMKVMDALSDLEFAQQGVPDVPIPSIKTALEFVAEGVPCWCYYCCGPRGHFLNRLLDTPLPKIAMHGMLFYRWPFQGFLHWGYNYWYRSQTRKLIDPYTVQDGEAWVRGWAYGDPFQVYPGPDGPVDSIRWEVFAASLQDYRLLQTLGVPRDHPQLADIHSFEDFPKDAAWRDAVRRALLERGAAS